MSLFSFRLNSHPLLPYLPHSILAEGSPWPEGTGAVRGVHVTGARGVDNVPVAVTHTVGRTRKAEVCKVMNIMYCGVL